MPKLFSTDPENLRGLRDVIIAVSKEVQTYIDNDMADEITNPEDDEPSIDLTIGFTPDDGSWDYQTGDNSYSGCAYAHTYWGVGTVYADSDPDSLADEIAADCDGQIYE